MIQRFTENRLMNIRALAITLVVLGHSIILYSTSWNLYETNHHSVLFDSLKAVINVIQMPLFIAIAGYSLYFTLQRYDNLSSFLRKKVKRLLIPFFIIGLLWMVPFRLLSNYEAYQNESIVKIIVNMLLGIDSGHLWFLPTLFLIFCGCGLTIWILKSCDDKKISTVFMILSLIMIAMQCIGWHIPSYAGSVVEYFPFFAEGYLIHVYQERFNTLYVSIISSALLITCVLLNYYVYRSVLFSIVISASCIILLFVLIPRRTCAWAKLLSKDSMGIYLLHSPMIYTSFAFASEIPPALMLVLNFFGFGCIALILTETIRALHLKFILGE